MAEAYDTILVQFRNKASRPYSMHAQVPAHLSERTIVLFCSVDLYV